MKYLTIILLAIAIVFIVALILAFPFMHIWNYAVVSALTIAKPITYWVAFWLMMFIGLFISSSKTSSS